MGSSLAPLMADFALDMIERNITTPKFFIRYVDDCLAAFDNDEEATDFLTFLNSHHESLQFTIERAVNKQINFLDMTIYNEDNKIKTKWYIKPTNTLLYTNRLSYSPNTYKYNAIKALHTRSQKLTSDLTEKIRVREKVIEIFQKNGYPERIITSCIDKNKEQATAASDEERKKIFGSYHL